jgi:hypothetical protein
MARLFEEVERRRSWRTQGAGRYLGGIGAVVAVAVLAAAVAASTLLCRQLLVDAAAGDAVPASAMPFYAAGACFLLGAFAVVVLQSIRVAQRVSGSQRRLVESLQRIRSGDLAFRVHLRRGDLLTDLAHECNALLEWLNASPPQGARTGTDVFDVDPFTDVGIAGELEEAQP